MRDLSGGRALVAVTSRRSRRETWAKLYLSSAGVEELVKGGEIEIQRGTTAEVARLFEIFDKYRPQKAVLVRPHLHD